MNTRDTIKKALKGRIMTMVFTKKNGDIRKAYGQIVENDQRPSDDYPNLITFVDFSVGVLDPPTYRTATGSSSLAIQ